MKMILENKLIFNKFRYKKEKSGNYLIITEDGIITKTTDKQFNEIINKEFTNNESKVKDLENNHILITKKNLKSIQTNLIKRRHYIFNGPSLHIIVLSNRCNHKCLYCHASSASSSKSEFDMSFETADNVIKTIQSSKEKELTVEFQGGEPLLNYDVLKHIVKKLQKSNIKINFTITTNLQLMTDEILNYFIENKIKISTSLDGDEISHNKIRKTEDKDFNSQKNVVKWIKKINEKYQIGALTTMNKVNMANYKEMIDTYYDLNMEGIFLRDINYLGTAQSTYDIVGYHSDDYIEFYKNALEHIINLNEKKEKIFIEYHTLILLKKLLNFKDPNLSEIRSPSGSGIGQLAYNYNGNIYSCDEGRMINNDSFIIGKAGQTIKEILGSEKISDIVYSSINDGFECNECIFKPFCGLNPIENYSEFNTLTPINFLSRRCIILKFQFEYLIEKFNDPRYKKVFSMWLSL